MNRIVALVGTLDTKGREYGFLKESIEKRGFRTLVVDVGILGKPLIGSDIGREEVAAAGGVDMGALIRRADRGEAVSAMARGIAVILAGLHQAGRIHGVLALGGGGGTSIACAGMRALPIGIPKVMVSTLADGDVSGFVGAKDIVMIPSLVDVSGLNRISRKVFLRAAAAVCAMVDAVSAEEASVEVASVEGASAGEPLIAATMFGNTTPAVGLCREIFEDAGFEVVVFPCSGTSGRVMEELIASGQIDGVLDMTTTEWADELVGGVLGAGKGRMDAAAERGVPQVVVPGCLDMVNFWAADTVPSRFRDRLFYHHNPNITLMRTNVEECRELGRILAAKLNRTGGDAAVFIPLRGLSMIDAPGGPFWWPEADGALFDALKENLRDGIPVMEMDHNINDPAFASGCAEALLDMLSR
jgi:uncharacterized protein (UPF0261 family)